MVINRVKVVVNVTFVISDDSRIFRGYTMNRIAKSVSVSFMPEMYQRINEFCNYRGCTRSWFMNKAAELFLNECLEDKADYEAAAAAWTEYEKSGFKSYTLDEVSKELGL